MTDFKKIHELVERLTRPQIPFGLPERLPRAVLELAVLRLVEKGDKSGFDLIRKLAPLNRHVHGYGVNYPLLHQMEEEGYLQAIEQPGFLPRVYRLTARGKARLAQLHNKYNLVETAPAQPVVSFCGSGFCAEAPVQATA